MSTTAEGEVDGVLVILQRDEGETPAMTSDRATMVAALIGTCSKDLLDGEIMSACRKAVWSDHCGCVYAANNRRR